VTTDASVLHALRERANWPKQCPFPELEVVGRPGEGLSLALECIEPGDKPFVVLEIGAEFGGSTRKFLSAADNVWVVSIDPWPDRYRTPWKALEPLLGSPESMLRLFQSFCWPYRERSIPVRGFSPEAVVRLFEQGLRPQLVYIDGDHRYDAAFSDLTICHALFPDAVLCGDDWQFLGGAPKYRAIRFPVRRAVHAFCLHRGYGFSAHEQTWRVYPNAPVQPQTLRRRFSDLAEEAEKLAAETPVGASTHTA
jgi:hypothetical protein